MRGQTNDAILQPQLQRRLRNGMTDAERHLWRMLRSRQLDDCKFRRQHPYYHYVLDFVCLERKVVVEVDGGQHAHSTTDPARDAFLREGDFIVLRFWNHDVLNQTEAVAESIHRALVARRSHHPHPDTSFGRKGNEVDRHGTCPVANPHHPHPGPPLEGEGEEPR